MIGVVKNFLWCCSSNDLKIGISVTLLVLSLMNASLISRAQSKYPICPTYTIIAAVFSRRIIVQCIGTLSHIPIENTTILSLFVGTLFD